MTIMTKWRPTRPACRGPAARIGAPVLAALAAGCVSRADFSVPAPPLPVRFEVAAAPLPAGPLTAGDVVALVRERNPTVAQARARAEAAAGALDAAESALLPRLTAGASYARSDAPSAYLLSRIDSHSLPAMVDFNHPGRVQSVDGALTARWNAWDGGTSRLESWARGSDAAAAELGSGAAANALSAAALAAFLDARAAAQLLAADDASVRSVESQIGQTRTRVEGGAALRSDLLSLEVRLAEARESRIRNDVARRMALAALRGLLALPADADVALSGEAFLPSTLPSSLPEAVAEAFRRRPDVASARLAVESARLRLEAASRGSLPRVDVEARAWSASGDATLLNRDPNWTVALAVTFDAFDGGANRAAVRGARAALRAVEEADRRALLEVASDVETALLRLEEATARVDVASQAVSAAEESLALVDTEYRGGAATVTRFLEAESACLRARTAVVASRLALERARVDVARAIGLFAGPGELEVVR